MERIIAIEPFKKHYTVKTYFNGSDGIGEVYPKTVKEIKEEIKENLSLLHQNIVSHFNFEYDELCDGGKCINHHIYEYFGDKPKHSVIKREREVDLTDFINHVWREADI